MSEVSIEQATYRRDRDEAPRLLARSPSLADELFGPLEEILVRFGERPAGISCPGAVFAQPLGEHHVAIVQVTDGDVGPGGWASLRYHALILSRADYASLGGDPFALARRIEPRDTLDTLRLPAEPLAPRGLAEIRAVLQRIKANALPENADPENPPPLTIDNAESPTLLGGAQVLVDGGKLVFERPRPDPSVVEALWILLPHSLRPRLWPASFAFDNTLAFDVLVVPRISAIELVGYTTEEQAGDYPAGSYELALQIAVEAGDVRDLESVLLRRSSNDTLRLAAKLLVGICLLFLASRLFTPEPRVDVVPRAAAVAGIVGVRDPWTALPMIEFGNRAFQTKK